MRKRPFCVGDIMVREHRIFSIDDDMDDEDDEEHDDEDDEDFDDEEDEE